MNEDKLNKFWIFVIIYGIVAFIVTGLIYFLSPIETSGFTTIGGLSDLSMFFLYFLWGTFSICYVVLLSFEFRREKKNDIRP